MRSFIKRGTLIHKIGSFIYNITVVYFQWLIFKTAKNGVIWNRLGKGCRPFLWKLTGVDIQGRCSIGYDVYYDVGNAKRIHIEEGVWIASRTLLLCHKRDLSNYYYGDDYNKQPHKYADITLKKGCCVGMGSIVMPGVTIGEGAIIGAGSLVVKDIPPYTVAVGNPAKVVKTFEKRPEEA
jgi:acetyltransferase-like isoleucine patch superfamily enzyme